MAQQALTTIAERIFVTTGVTVVAAAAVMAAPPVRPHLASATSSAVQLVSADVTNELDSLSLNTAAVEPFATGDDDSPLDPSTLASVVASVVGDDVAGPYSADSIGDVLLWPLRFLEGVVEFVWHVATWPVRLLVDVVEEVWHLLTLPFSVADHVFDAAAVPLDPGPLSEALSVPDLSGLTDFTPDLGGTLPDLAG